MFNYPDLTAEVHNNQRWYNTPFGFYPSITTVLGATESEEAKASLKRWQDSLGAEEAARKSKEATDKGTNVHLMAERFLKQEDVFAPIDGVEIPIGHIHSFNALKPKLKKVNEVWGQEVALYSRYVEIAGRTDLICVYNGIPSIVDYKTATRLKDHSDIISYKLQLAFYAIAHNEMFNTDIQQGVILMSAGEGFPLEFKININDWVPELKMRSLKFWDHALNSV